MLERALMAILFIGAAMLLAEFAADFHPIQLAADVISGASCGGDWSREACQAAKDSGAW